MKSYLPLLLPFVMFTIFISAILHVKPVVFFVASEEKIPGIVQAVVAPPVIKAGQIWGMRRGNNPFEKRKTAAHVVAVEDGYVKYYFAGQENYGEWAAQSDPASFFAEMFTERVK